MEMQPYGIFWFLVEFGFGIGVCGVVGIGLYHFANWVDGKVEEGKRKRK